ncbi:hypothetical protein KAJ27_00580 [bacterium]|nr:hypothetical protein [bacterium]
MKSKILSIFFLLFVIAFSGTIFSQQEEIRKALTWKKTKEITELEIVYLSNAGGNPYKGDMSVEEALPILAIKVTDLPRPGYPIKKRGGAMHPAYYQGWSGGHVKLTPPIKGYLLSSRKKADEIVKRYCGNHYRMAEFHDGKYITGMNEQNYYGDSWTAKSKSLNKGGWGFWAHGEIPDNIRFWVCIDDQPANPWNRGTSKSDRNFPKVNPLKFYKNIEKKEVEVKW